MEIKDYTFKTKDPMPTNAHNMECFLNSDEHFYAVFPRDSEVTFEDGGECLTENFMSALKQRNKERR